MQTRESSAPASQNSEQNSQKILVGTFFKPVPAFDLGTAVIQPDPIKDQKIERTVSINERPDHTDEQMAAAINGFSLKK